jgi:prepilin-type N-terminal cleavage/methylation domain-containing protein
MMNSRAQGFSLAELLVVTLVGSIVLGAVYQTMTTQTRANRQQTAIVTTQQSARTGIDVLMSELREVSASKGDILAATSTTLRFRALQKAGIVCDKDYANNNRLDIAYHGTAFGQDSILVFADNSATSATDDDWTAQLISSTDNSATCTLPGMGNQRLHFASAALASVQPGALVRSFRIVEYQLINAGAEARLQRTDVATNSSVDIAESLATVANQGLRLRYFNAAGTEITPSTQALRAQIVRIEVKVRARAIGGQTGANREFSDSLVNQVFLRGNYKTS